MAIRLCGDAVRETETTHESRIFASVPLPHHDFITHSNTSPYIVNVKVFMLFQTFTVGRTMFGIPTIFRLSTVTANYQIGPKWNVA